MIKTNLLAVALILLTACASNAPISTQDALSSITIKKDQFNNSTTIETPMYLSKKGFTDTFPVRLKYRAHYQGSERQFIQLYLSITNTEWGFYHSANSQDGRKLVLKNIDHDVDAHTFKSVTTVEEHVGLLIPMEYLQSMSNNDFSIKLYGKRKSGDFVVPSSLTKAFLQKLNCFEANTCS